MSSNYIPLKYWDAIEYVEKYGFFAGLVYVLTGEYDSRITYDQGSYVDRFFEQKHSRMFEDVYNIVLE